DELKAAHEVPKAVPVSPGPSAAPPPAVLSYVPAGPPTAAALLPPQSNAPLPAQVEAKRGGFLGSGIELTLGGFLEGATIYRSRNETADISSAFNTIPFPNSPNYHLSEFHFSAHQTRLSLLAQGRVDAATALAGYVESDFQSAPASESSIESNSYSPRLRQAYATLDRSDLGLHILGGQAFSLLTLFNHGLMPRQERIPLK